MKPREVYHFGPWHDERSIILVVPTIEGGLFRQPPHYLGAIALISQIEPAKAKQIAEGDSELFRSYLELDLEVPGKINMMNGARIAVVPHTTAGMTMVERTIPDAAQYGVGWVEEFEPLSLEHHLGNS